MLYNLYYFKELGGWILCDRRISLRVKGKVYKTVVRPAMMYGAEMWAVGNEDVKMDEWRHQVGQN